MISTFLKNTLLAIFLITAPAYQVYANVGGSDLQNFNPTTNGLDFITVHSGNTLDPGEFNLGTILTYTTNSLPYSTIPTAPGGLSLDEPQDRLLYSYLHIGVGILQGWDLGVSGGFINSQNISQSNYLFTYGDTGINEFRINTKVRLIKNENWGFATIATMDLDQIKNNPFNGDNAGPTFNFEGALDWKLSSNLHWALNGGYRLKQVGTTIPNTGVTPLSNQITYSTALAYHLNDNHTVLTELYGSVPIEQSMVPTDRELSNLEILLGYRTNIFEKVSLHTGFGSDIYQLTGSPSKGLGSPDFRFYFGLNWRPNLLPPNTTPEKQVSNPQPIVPSQQEPVAEKPLTDKLPEKNIQLKDSDADGIEDSKDKCPKTSPGSAVNAYGCPIETFKDN